MQPALKFEVVKPEALADIVVSNISADPLGTPPQAGNIEFHFYGENAPGTVPISSVVLAGQVYSTRASIVAPDFNGYVIARCAFSPARGIAIIRDIGAKSLTTSYLAEVIDVVDNKVQPAQGPVRMRQISTLEIDPTPEDLSD